MNDSPKHRKNDLKVSAHFRSHRIHAINGEWYFLTREGQNIGPFLNQKEAEAGIAEFLKIVQKDE